MLSKNKNLLRNESGQGLTEYLILIILIAGVSIAAAKTLGSTIKGKIELAQRHIRSDISIEESGSGGGGGGLGGIADKAKKVGEIFGW